MNNSSIAYNLLPTGKTKPKAIKLKLNNEQLQSIDQFLIDVLRRKKEKATGGKKIEYLTKKEDGAVPARAGLDRRSGLTKHEGRFLPLLLASLPYLATIGSLAGGSAAIANAVINEKKTTKN